MVRGWHQIKYIRPVIMHEVETSDLLDMMRKQGHSGIWNCVICKDVKRRPVGACGECRHVVLALVEEQLGPQRAVLKKRSAPITAHGSGLEKVPPGREVGRDEG